MGILASAFLYFAGQWIVYLLYGRQYMEAVPIVKLMCLYLIPFMPIAMFLNTILIYFGYDKSYLYTMLWALLINTIMSITLIKYFSLTGAVIALGLTALTLIIVSTYYLIKYNKIECPKILIPN